MARNYILGGMAATQLQAGKPYFKRITRINGTAAANDAIRQADELTVTVNDGDGMGNAADGRIDKGVNSDGWEAGEILMIEFPTTMRNVQVLLEETHLGSDAVDPMDPDIQEKEDLGEGKIRCRVMLAAPGQNVGPAGEADPVANANYIEIKVGETATINSRQKVLFIVINKFNTDNVLAADGTVALPVAGHASDMASILVTGVLDHEPGANASSAANEPVSIVRENGVDRELRQIWGAGDGIG